MNYFDFQTSAIKWYESYLSNIKFLVCIDDVFSEAGRSKYGAPKALFLDRSFCYYFKMIYPNHYQKLAPICMQMALLFRFTSG